MYVFSYENCFRPQNICVHLSNVFLAAKSISHHQYYKQKTEQNTRQPQPVWSYFLAQRNRSMAPFISFSNRIIIMNHSNILCIQLLGKGNTEKVKYRLTYVMCVPVFFKIQRNRQIAFSGRYCLEGTAKQINCRIWQILPLRAQQKGNRQIAFSGRHCF